MSNLWMIVFAAIVFFLIVIKILITELKIAVKLFAIAIIFLLTTGGYVYFETNSDIKNPEGTIDFAKIYFVWLSTRFSDTMDFSGYVSSEPNKNKTN